MAFDIYVRAERGGQLVKGVNGEAVASALYPDNMRVDEVAAFCEFPGGEAFGLAQGAEFRTYALANIVAHKLYSFFKHSQNCH